MDAAEAAKKKTAEWFCAESNMHTVGRRRAGEVWANARLRSLALSVPHYVPEASEDLNP